MSECYPRALLSHADVYQVLFFFLSFSNHALSINLIFFLFVAIVLSLGRFSGLRIHRHLRPFSGASLWSVQPSCNYVFWRRHLHRCARSDVTSTKPDFNVLFLRDPLWVWIIVCVLCCFDHLTKVLYQEALVCNGTCCDWTRWRIAYYEPCHSGPLE